ncbi:MAG TPA: SAM-dependent methyltransferase [Candidatus Binatia bacterium]|jgi:predicted methyltransferase
MGDSATISASRHLGSLLLLFAAACAVTAPDYRAILSHAERPENERQLDAARKPDQVMTFYGVKSGDKAADLLAGRGYYTMILSQMVGADGLVYSTNTRPREEWSDRFKRPPFTNVRTVVGPMDKIDLPQDGSLDFALTHLNYHDLPQPARAGMNKRVLAALRKGGIYGVVDHSAREGSGDSDSKTLHRIDKRLVIKEVTDSGFKLVAEGDMLSRPDDKRDFNVNKVRNQNDRFVLKFVKP